MNKNKIALGLLLGSLSFNSISSFAQVNTTTNENKEEQVYQELKKDHKKEVFNNVLKYLLTSVSIQKKFYSLDSESLQNTKGKVAVGLEGQIIDLGTEAADEYYDFPSFRVIPYELYFTEDGRKFVKIGIVSGSILLESIMPDQEETKLEFSVISVEYNEDYLVDNQLETYVKLIEAETKIQILGGAESIVQVYLKGGFDLGASGRLENQNFDLNGGDYGIGLGAGLTYGAEVKLNTSNTSSISLGIDGYSRANRYTGFISDDANNRRTLEKNNYLDAVEEAQAAQAQWDQDKYNWEVENGYYPSVSNSFYMDSTGAPPRPESAEGSLNTYNEVRWYQDVSRRLSILNPSLTYTKQLKSGNSLSVNLNANLVLKDNIKGKNAYNPNSISGSREGIQVRNDEILPQTSLIKGIGVNRVNIGITFQFGNKARVRPATRNY